MRLIDQFLNLEIKLLVFVKNVYLWIICFIKLKERMKRERKEEKLIHHDFIMILGERSCKSWFFLKQSLSRDFDPAVNAKNILNYF